MNVHGLILFLHVGSAIGIFVAMGLEGVSLRRLRLATSYQQAREWTSLGRVLLGIGLPAVLGVVASGIYLAILLGAWELDWVKVALPLVVAVAVVGAITGPRRGRLQAALASGEGPLSAQVQAQIQHPLILASWRLRLALVVALVFDMTVKPDPVVLPLMLYVVGVLALDGLGFLPRRSASSATRSQS